MWLVDGKSIGRANAKPPCSIAATDPGRHTITVMDEAGHYDQVEIRVQ